MKRGIINIIQMDLKSTAIKKSIIGNMYDKNKHKGYKVNCDPFNEMALLNYFQELFSKDECDQMEREFKFSVYLQNIISHGFLSRQNFKNVENENLKRFFKELFQKIKNINKGNEDANLNDLVRFLTSHLDIPDHMLFSGSKVLLFLKGASRVIVHATCIAGLVGFAALIYNSYKTNSISSYDLTRQLYILCMAVCIFLHECVINKRFCTFISVYKLCIIMSVDAYMNFRHKYDEDTLISDPSNMISKSHMDELKYLTNKYVQSFYTFGNGGLSYLFYSNTTTPLSPPPGQLKEITNYMIDFIETMIPSILFFPFFLWHGETPSAFMKCGLPLLLLARGLHSNLRDYVHMSKDIACNENYITEGNISQKYSDSVEIKQLKEISSVIKNLLFLFIEKWVTSMVVLNLDIPGIEILSDKQFESNPNIIQNAKYYNQALSIIKGNWLLDADIIINMIKNNIKSSEFQSLITKKFKIPPNNDLNFKFLRKITPSIRECIHLVGKGQSLVPDAVKQQISITDDTTMYQEMVNFDKTLMTELKKLINKNTMQQEFLFSGRTRLVEYINSTSKNAPGVCATSRNETKETAGCSEPASEHTNTNKPASKRSFADYWFNNLLAFSSTDFGFEDTESQQQERGDHHKKQPKEKEEEEQQGKQHSHEKAASAPEGGAPKTASSTELKNHQELSSQQQENYTTWPIKDVYSQSQKYGFTPNPNYKSDTSKTNDQTLNISDPTKSGLYVQHPQPNLLKSALQFLGGDSPKKVIV